MDIPAELELNDDRAIPQLGFGVWQIPQGETADLVATAVGKGYRPIDGAYIYGNEAEMGEGVRHSGVERDEIVTRKSGTRIRATTAPDAQASAASIKSG